MESFVNVRLHKSSGTMNKYALVKLKYIERNRCIIMHFAIGFCNICLIALVCTTVPKMFACDVKRHNYSFVIFSMHLLLMNYLAILFGSSSFCRNTT